MSTVRKHLVALVLATTICCQAVLATVNNTGQPVSVGVFYESRCPDTRRFFINQLVPAYREFGYMFKPQLVPFGHARTLGNNKMICQHGARECEGNRLMACVQARGKSDGDILETLGCLFQMNLTPKECVEKHLKGASFDDVDKCKNSEESYQMMVKNEQITGKISYVPKVTMNGQYSEDVQQECEHDLKGCICKNYSGSDKSDKCQPPTTSKP